MKKIVRNCICISSILISFNSLSQVKSTFGVESGVFVDSMMNGGGLLKYSYYIKNKPLSLSFGIGANYNVQRNGVEFDYAYSKNTNVLTNLSLNYILLNKSNGFTIDLSPRLVFLSNSLNTYKNFKDVRLNKMVTVDETKYTTYMGFGFATTFKNRFNNNVALYVSLGADYLPSANNPWVKTVHLGLEFPLVKLNSTKTRKTKVKEEKPSIKKEEQKQKVEKKNEVKVIDTPKPIIQDTLKVITNNLSKSSLNKIGHDTIKPNTSELIINQTKEKLIENVVVDKIVETPKRDTIVKTESTPVVIIKKKKKVENVELPVVEEKKKEEINPVKISTEPKNIPDTKLKGPENVPGTQIELGDDWNYWEGDNQKWYAKHKDKLKWYDLFESLSNSNYNKAVQTLEEKGKLVK